MFKVGILHPGEMGISIAASALNSGQQVYWASAGRSEMTRQRASQHKLIDLETPAQLFDTCEVILSVCPPHAAEEVAGQVMSSGFKGIYLDANAIAPERAKRIGEQLTGRGIQFVDGSIIGPPAWQAGETWLYLAGEKAEWIASLFSKGSLETKVIGEEIGKASALKMCYAAYSKGTTALLGAILAAAESLKVRDELYRHWEMDNTGFSEKTDQRVARVTAKAWRFEGEMREIAATFAAEGLPDGFHLAAAELYRRMANFKDLSTPPLEEVWKALLEG